MSNNEVKSFNYIVNSDNDLVASQVERRPLIPP